MNRSQEIISLTEQFGARNYRPLPMVVAKAEGAWVEDPEGKRYLDMLSAYSAVNQGHRHPRIMQALLAQAERATLSSRAFHNDQLGLFYQKVSELTQKQMVLPMNTGAEAVETALKAIRRWGHEVKGIPQDQAEIIACEGNFHGRTIAAISMSSEPEYKRGFGPLLPGVKLVPYGDIAALQQAITPDTAGFLVEPLQGEAGVRIPKPGFLSEAYRICHEQRVLFAADEIQSGLGRTGKRFACDWENVVPDIYIIGKALGGGVIPVSCVAANEDVLGVFNPGSHGSTFGGNPLACAVAVAALTVLEEEQLADRSLRLGAYFLTRLQEIRNPLIKEIRGRGLFIGMELFTAARPYCERLMQQGLLCKETHDNVIRFAPPLVISEADLDWAIERILSVLQA